MKKTLLFTFAILYSFNLMAQQMSPGWAVYHSGYTEESRGISRFGVLKSTAQDVAWSVAFDGSGNNADISAVAYTNDGGVTWTAYDPVSLPGAVNPGISMVYPTDENTAYIAAYKRSFGNGGIWKTTDAGANWTKVSTNAMYSDNASFCNVVYFVDANNGFSQGDPINGEFEMYYTTDAGATWTPIAGSDIADPLSGEYGYTGGVVAAGSSIWFTTNKGRLYKSTDNGLTWNTAYQTPLTDFGSATDSGSVTFKDDNEGWILRGNGELYHTLDGGATWTQMSPTMNPAPPTAGEFFSGDIAFIPGTQNTLICTDADYDKSMYGAAISYDGGQNWEKMIYYDFGQNGADGVWEVLQPDGNIQHLSLGFRDIDFGLSGGFSHLNDPNDPDSPESQGVFKYINEAVGIAGQTIEGLSVYPNPASNVVNVATDNAAIKHISIYDITGKEVYKVNDLSLNNTTINVSNLQRGIYLMKIEDASNAKQAVKLVIK
jgi:photosystem II stability/assembly factor-like uncharacterized protein